MSFTREEKLAITAVILAALIGLGVMLYYMGIITFSGSGITGAVAGTNLPPEFTASSAKFVTKQNVPVQLSLGDIFKDPEGLSLTFVATNTEGLVVDLNEDQLTITPEPGFTGERVVTVFASDGSQVARKQLKIEVTGYNVAKKPEPTPEPEPLPPAPEPQTPQPAPETTPPAPETVPAEPANATNTSNETLPAPEQAPVQTEQPAAELPIILPATEQIAVQQQNIPKVEHEVEERLNNESEITAIVYFNESAVNEAGLIVAQDSKDQRENWLAKKRAKVKAARELLLANITSKGFTTSELGFEIVRQYETINAIAVKLTKSGLAKLNQSPNVLNIYSEKILHIMLNQSVPLINAEDLWNLTYNNTKLDGRGVSVCIVDTGIDFGNSAFVNENAKIFGGYDFVNMDNNPQDDNGHGTHCSGIVGGNMTGGMGVSPNIGIVPVKVCDSGGSCPDVAVLAGLDYCIDHSAEFNISTISGSIGSGTTYNSANCPADSDAVFLSALAAGVTPVFAAGNWGSRPGVSWPSCSPYAISVGNVNKSDIISVSSNYGGDRFDVWAPGSNIYSAALGGGVVPMSGTSMATPHMAAVIAMIQYNLRLQNKPILSITQMHELLNTTGLVISDWRRIDVYAAILKLNANLTMNQSDNSITNVTANTTLQFKNTTNFDGFIQCGAIGHNYVSIDSSLCPNLNKTAHIIFGNLSFVNATPTRNGQRCRTPICQNATYANGTLEFDVTEFSSYSSIEGNVNMDLIKLDSQDPVNASSYLNYTILINVTQGNASNITLTDLYPEQLIYLDSQPLPVPPTNNTFVIGNFTENQSILVNISLFVLNVSNNTQINNTANVSFQNDTSSWINASVSESTIILNQPLYNFTNISLNKTDSIDPVNSSDYLNYTINLTLTGNGSAYNVTVNDTYPSQVIYQSSQPDPRAGTNNTWNWTSISSGASILINITVFTKNVSNGTILNNTVNVTCVNDTAGVMSFFSYAETTISSVFNVTNTSMLKIHSPDPINASSVFNYTINFTNTGTAVIYSLKINDTYPTPLTYISAQPSPDPGTNNYWTLGTFVPNATIIINISMSVPNLANGVMLNNTANATYQNDIGDIIPLTAQDNTPVNNPPNSCPVTINTTTTLNSNLNSGTSCITIGGNNIVLDCAGYQVTHNTGGGNSDYGIGADRKSNITIQNCVIIDNIGTGSYISGINFTKVNSSLIRNTVINSTGSSYTFGISLRDRDQNVTVTNVTIKTRGSSTYNFGVQMFNSTGNIVANSTILANSTSGSEVYGVLIDDYSQNNTVYNSTITADGTSNYNTGVYLRYTVSNNIVSGNTIKALSSATLAYSVYLNSNNNQMSQNKVINNNLTVNCSSTCYGVYVLYSSTNGIIENNTVNSAGRGNGNTNYGIFLWSSGGGGPGNYTIKNNTVRTYGIGDLNHGIHIWGNWNVNNNSVINNNVFPSGTGRANIAIYLIGASSTRVIGNNISTYGTQENHGIDVSSGSAGCLVANNTIVTNGSAGYNYGLLAVTGGDNSTFADNNVTVRGTDSIGIYSDTSQGNYFLNNQVNTSGSDGLMILGENIVYFATNSIATTNTINGTPIYYYGGAGSSPACPNNQVLNSPNTNHIDFIGCNNVTLSNYAGSEGILLANNSNSTINYTVIRNTRYPVRLLFNSSYNNITYSNLTSNYSSGGYGVWIAYSAGNNLVSASNITTIGLATDNNYGVYIFGNASNNTITNSHISTNGSRYNYGVYATLNANDNTVSNNLIRTKGSSNDNKGAYLYSFASGNSIINNTIITNGTNYDDGIHVSSYSNNNRLENNTINADGTDFVYGINVQTNSQNNTVKGNNITIYTPTTNIQTANGIYLQDLATKTTVDKNSILMYTYAMFNFEKNHGISVTNAHNNTITNNRVDTTGLFDFHIGIYLYYSSNNLFENNTVITGGRNYNHGIVTWGVNSNNQCNNNTIKNNTILVNGTAGINYGIYEYQYNNKNDILGNRIVTNCTYSCNGIYSPTSGSNAMIANNTIIASGTSGSTSNYGIYMYSGSNNNVMADNNITTTGPFSHGIQLVGSTNETLHNNNITIPALAMGLYIDVDSTTPDISQFMHTIDTQNTINGTPIYYYGGLGDSPACPNNQVLNSPNSNHLDFIGCNNATLNGFTAFEPVTIVNATNSTINNSRISNAYVGVRLFFNSTYNTISNCNITSENTTGSNYGILMHYWSSNNIINNNNISATSGTSGNYGIYLFNSSKENNITNNFILVNGTSSNYGIYIQRMSSKNLFENNNIRLKGTSNTNYGVYIYQSSEGNTIRNSTINTNSTGGATSNGVVIENYASNNTITGCTIRDWTSYGIYFTTNSHNNTASYNDMQVNNANIASEYGIYLNGPFSGTQVVGNNITSNCSQNCYGLNVYNTVQNGIIANNTIRTIGGNANNHGIYLNYEDTNNNISGNRINAMGRGIWIQTASQPNRFNDNNITAIGDYAVYLQSATGSLFNNTFFDNSTYWINSDASSRNNFTNTAFGTALARITILPIIQLNTTTIQWSQINSSFNKTYINSTALPYFNTSGLVTLNGMTGSVASALVDYNDDNVYEDCPSDVCVQQSFSGGTFVFNTTHFTGYSANTSEGPLVITSCPVTINSSYTLTQNLITSANKSCITMNSSNITLDCAGHTILYATNGTNNTHGVFAFLQNNLTVKDCVIMSVNSSLSYSSGINFTNVTNILIQNNTIVTNGTRDNHGFFARYSNNVTVINNTITVGTTHENYAIIAANSDRGLIANNTATSCCGNTATGLFGQTNFTITNNAVNVTGASSSAGITVGNENWVENNTVEVHALNVNSGIITSDRVTVRNNTIYINGTSDNIGVNANNRDLVVMNNITVIGTSYCYALSGDSGNVFENNTARLFASGHDNAGVYDNYNNVIKNNSILMNGTYANEGMRTRDNSTIIGNTLTISHATDDNAIIYAYSDTTLQYNNFILNGSGSTNVGLDISYNDNFPPVIGNNLSISGTNTITGIYMSGQTNVTVIGNNVTLTASDTGNAGIDVNEQTFDSTIANNTVYVSGGDESQGVRFVITNIGEISIGSAIVENNSITTNGLGTGAHGIAILYVNSGAGGISNNKINNNRIIANGTQSHGIYEGNGTSNTISNNNITSLQGYAVWVDTGIGDLFDNNTLSNPAQWVFVNPSGDAYLKNTTFQMPSGSIRVVPAVLLENGTNATKTRLQITYLYAFLNSTNLSVLNTSAVITFEAVALTNPKPIVDYEDDSSYINCPADQCVALGAYTPGGQYVYNTTHFTVYSAAETEAECPYTYTASTTLTEDITCPATAIILNADNLVLDCNGHKVRYAGNTNNSHGVFATGRSNITVRNCNLLSINNTIGHESGINFTNVNNSLIERNNITTNGTTHNYGIETIRSNNNIIRYNNITANGTRISSVDENSYNYGIYLLDNEFSSNANNSITGNTINCAGDKEAHCLHLQYSSNNTILRNNITAIGKANESVNTYGMFVWSSGSNISRNNIQVSGGSDNNGIFLRYSQYNSIIYNNISTNGNRTTGGSEPATLSYDYGIIFYLGQHNHTTVYGNTITTNSEGGGNNHGIYFFRRSENMNVSNNNITLLGGASSSYGLYLYEDVLNGVFDSNRIEAIGTSGYMEGIVLYSDSGYNNFTNNVITTSGTDNNYGVYISGVYNTGENNFHSTNITTSGPNSYGIRLENGATGTNFNNTILNDTAEWIYMDDGTYTGANITNTTFQMPDGSINLPGTVENIGFTLDATKQKLNITPNLAFLNSSDLYQLNITGIIALNGLAFSNPEPTVDWTDEGAFVICPGDVCTELDYSGGIFTYWVNHFTGYSSQETSGGITSCPVTINESTTLTQNLTSATTSCIRLNNSNTVLDCADHIINGSDIADTFGIYAENVTNLTIKNCIVIDWDAGIKLSNTSSDLLLNNTAISNINNGFLLDAGNAYYTFNNTLENNSAIGNDNTGIRIENTQNNTLKGSILRNNLYYGIFVSGDLNFIYNSTVINNSYGIVVNEGRDVFGYNNTIENNTAVNNTQTGIGVSGTQNTTIRYNTLRKNLDWGISANGVKDLIYNNTFFENGIESFTIEAFNGAWQTVSIEHFPNKYAQHEIAVPAGTTKVRVTQTGTDTAHIDMALLDGMPPASAMDKKTNELLPLKPISAKDYDVIDANERAIEFAWAQPGTMLSLAAVEEDVGGIPLAWPDNDAFAYVIGQNKTFERIWKPVSAHPESVIFAEFSATPETLNMYLDMTPDNTLDYSGDWAELRINTTGGMKAFRINSTETTWGTADFTYTDKVVWRHKTYLFAIPLSEINAVPGDEIKFQIGYYGTGFTVPDAGIKLQGMYNLVFNNTHQGDENGIFAYTAESCIIANNSINGSLVGGIMLRLGVGNNVSGNTVRNNDIGIGVNMSEETLLADNNATNNNGIGIFLESVSSNRIIRNIVSSAAGTGIRVSASTDNNITNNTLATNSGTTVAIGSTSLNNIFTNTTLLTNNTWLLVDEGCLGNVLNNTVFIGANGTIRIPGNATIPELTNATVRKLNITYNLAHLNSTNLSFLNTTGIITLKGIAFAVPRPIVDFNDDGAFEACPANICTELGYTPGVSYVYNVTHFTGYSSQETPGVQYNFTNISITKTDYPDPVNVSNYLNYTINVTISGNGTAYNVTVNDTYPPQVIYISSQPAPVAGTNNSWVLGNITATNITINITVLVQNITNNTLINNTANATCTNETLALLRVSDTENTTVLAPPVPPTYNFSNMTIRKIDNPDPVNASSNLTYQINVSSTGNGTAYNVTINDTYPEQVIYLTSQPTPVAGTNNSWVLGNLTPGTNISVNVTLLVLNITNGTIINNTANVTFQNETGALFVYGAFAETTVLNPPVFNVSNITVTKTGVPNPVAPGGQLNYTITVTSSGNGTAYNVTVNDTYPEQVIYLGSQPAPVAGTNNSWDIGNLTPGAVVLLNITVNVSESTANGTVINNTVNLTFNNETGALFGRSADASTNVSNVTPTPTPPGPSGGGGGSGGGGIGGVRRNTTTAPVQQGCVENWECGEWSACIDNSQSRSCIEANGCTNPQFAPQTQRSCQSPKPAQEEHPAELPSETQHSGLPEQQPLEFPEEKSGISISAIATSISAIAKPIINLFKAYLWPIIFIIIALLLLTAGYVVFTRRREDEGMQQIQMPGLQMPEEMQEIPSVLPEPKMPKPRPEPRIPEARPEPMMPARLILPRIGQKQQKSDKKFYTGIDAKLADINKKLASLDKTNKQLEKKLKKR